MTPRIWQPRGCDEQQARVLEHELGLAPVTARLLCIRGLGEVETARRFLAPALEDLHDPFALSDMATAVDRILGAVERGERIAVHGDYDVDGVTSTVILRRALELIGANVVHFIPERLRDGYGLQPASIERLHAEGAALVISVDCGIRGLEAARRARELGVDLIITDHHEPDVDLPCAMAVVNPKRHDCQYPDKNLAGVGVALKLVQALCARTNRSNLLPAFVKMAAIGTLADVVPLVGENRIIAKVGLGLLSRGPHRVGLRALIDVCGLTGREIDSYHIGFVMAPRINAAGRMSSSDIAARLLLATDESMADEARMLAETLDHENTRRQQEEAEIVAQARKIVETDIDVGSRTVIVVAGEGWHRGVIGIVASKLVDAFHRPAIVLSLEGEIAHGSCRSIPSFDLLAGLEASADVLMTFGGHKQAAGVTLGGRPRAGVARADQRPRRRPPGAGRPAATPVDRRAAAVQGHHRAGHRRAGQPGAVRRGQPLAGVHDERSGGHRRAAADQGAAPEDGVQAGRQGDAGDGVARRRSRGPGGRAQGRAGPGVLPRAGDLERRSIPSAVCCGLSSARNSLTGFRLPAPGFRLLAWSPGARSLRP